MSLGEPVDENTTVPGAPDWPRRDFPSPARQKAVLEPRDEWLVGRCKSLSAAISGAFNDDCDRGVPEVQEWIRELSGITHELVDRYDYE